MIIDLVIIISVYWWTIKNTQFWSNVETYCANKYSSSDTKADLTQCDATSWCGLKDYSYEDLDYCADNSWRYDYCECSPSQGVFGLMVAFWVITGLWTMGEILRLYRYATSSGFDGFSSHCICCAYNPFVNEFYRDQVRQHFHDRVLWNYGSDEPQCCCHCKIQGYFCDALTRFFGYILLAWISMEGYGYRYDNDYSIQRIEFYPVLGLIAVRMIIQLHYLRGEPYDEQKEWAPKIVQILVDRFGPDIGNEIKTLLPIFYDEAKCVRYYLLNQMEVELETYDGVKDTRYQP